MRQLTITVQAASSIQARQSSAKVTEGSSFTFEWDFNLQSGDKGKLREIIFGLWEKGYTSSYFITVDKLGGADENPQLGKKHPNYVGRVYWVGDISKSYVAFRLANIKLSDNNTYGCQLDIGGFGQTIDSKISLIVEKSALMNNASMFVRVPRARNVTVGEAAEFNWEYRLSNEDRKSFKAVQLNCPTCTYNHHKFLWRIDSNGNQFTNQEYADEGNFEFKIEFGDRRKRLENQVFLAVNEYPRIVSSPRVKGSYSVGEQLILACTADGKPKPKIKWIKNGGIIPHKTGSYYLVNQVSISDAGVYSCCASNQLGNVTSPGVHVQVKYAPSIVSPSDTKTVLSWRGHPTRLECLAVGYPPPKYSWKRADNRLSDGDFDRSDNASVLIITPTADTDFTNYTCIAENIIGQDITTFILKPIRPPSPPIITNIDVNYNAIKITWQTPPSKQDTPITGHVLQIKKKLEQFNKWKEFKFSAKSNYFIVRNLTKATPYRLRLYATNVAGRSNASFEKQVKTLTEGRPGLAKLHFTDIGINYTRFPVTWDYPDDNGGAEVIMFTVWYRAVRLGNNTQDKWCTVNVTHNICSLKLNCSLTYEIMVTAWNRNGPSFTDPDNAARISVLRGMYVCVVNNFNGVLK
ncbi:Neural cell adhesion molecule 1 [Desmophyllum pertusum]|uniref:Neural cell adhesion molecule 1 n=1 Tax=Desmophyllum pertusum TaxID=174260 RepID=A0A9X0D0M3_9CNID|nr:Neural cell adhesion molecule 1 [Desmophyllum pertusum]